MYWPIGTPRIYATSSSRAPAFKLFVTYDGLSSPPESGPTSPDPEGTLSRATADQAGDEHPLLPTPSTPAPPTVESVEQDDGSATQASGTGDAEADVVPSRDPILGLRVSRSGHMFVVITATTITVWQTKVRIASYR